MRRSAAILAVLAAVTAACGGSSSTATFSDPGATFTFSYPKDFARDFVGVKREVEGRAPEFSTNVGVNEANVVIASEYGIKRPFESYQPAAFQSLVDSLVRTITRADGARIGSIGHGKLGSLPAYTYDIEGPGDTRSHVVIGFRGRKEYFVKCTWKPAQEATIKSACDQVTTSFAVH